jgi:hypothetical protein
MGFILRLAAFLCWATSWTSRHQGDLVPQGEARDAFSGQVDEGSISANPFLMIERVLSTFSNGLHSSSLSNPSKYV